MCIVVPNMKIEEFIPPSIIDVTNAIPCFVTQKCVGAGNCKWNNNSTYASMPNVNFCIINTIKSIINDKIVILSKKDEINQKLNSYVYRIQDEYRRLCTLSNIPLEYRDNLPKGLEEFCIKNIDIDWDIDIPHNSIIEVIDNSTGERNIGFYNGIVTSGEKQVFNIYVELVIDGNAKSFLEICNSFRVIELSQ